MTPEQMARRNFTEDERRYARNSYYATRPGKALAGGCGFFVCMAVGMFALFFGLFLLGKLSRLVDF
jgi:hypothetical protein